MTTPGEALDPWTIEACAGKVDEVLSQAMDMDSVKPWLRVLAARIRSLATEQQRAGSDAPDVPGAIARLWSAYGLAGAARPELRLVFALLGEDLPDEDASPATPPGELEPLLEDVLQRLAHDPGTAGGCQGCRTAISLALEGLGFLRDRSRSK